MAAGAGSEHRSGRCQPGSDTKNSSQMERWQHCVASCVDPRAADDRARRPSPVTGRRPGWHASEAVPTSARGGWSGIHRDVGPNELLHCAGMQWQREQGYRYYDLEGIQTAVGEAILSGHDVATLDVQGLTHFKLGLGGDVTRFPGCYDSVHQPLQHPALPWLAPRLGPLTPVADRLTGRRKATSGTERLKSKHPLALGTAQGGASAGDQTLYVRP
jgi:hypothetical protein